MHVGTWNRSEKRFRYCTSTLFYPLSAMIESLYLCAIVHGMHAIRKCVVRDWPVRVSSAARSLCRLRTIRLGICAVGTYLKKRGWIEVQDTAAKQIQAVCVCRGAQLIYRNRLRPRSSSDPSMFETRPRVHYCSNRREALEATSPRLLRECVQGFCITGSLPVHVDQCCKSNGAFNRIGKVHQRRKKTQDWKDGLTRTIVGGLKTGLRPF
jgi:hypothetical protein